MLKSRKYLWHGGFLFVLLMLVLSTELVHINKSYPPLKGHMVNESKAPANSSSETMSTPGRSGSMLEVGPIKVTAFGDLVLTDKMELKMTSKNYYFVLYPYREKPYTSRYTRDGQEYMETMAWDSIKDGKWLGHFVETPMSVKYLRNESSPAGIFPQKPGYLLVPIEEGFYKFMDVVNKILFVILAGASLFFIFILPSKILLRVSRNEAFHHKNVPGLYAIGIFFISLWFFNSVVPIIFYWIFAGVVPPGFEFPYMVSLLDRKFLLVTGLAVFIVAKAFQRGYELEKELDTKLWAETKGH